MADTPATARDGIFISYRRDDARGASGRLYDWLRIAFGRDKVFRDVASIGPGKWRQRIDDALAASAVCLPVIGTRWCDATNGPRLAEQGDMVRHELVTALALSPDGLTLIPTLVEGAKLPSEDKLPAELQDLLRWNAYPLSEEGWEDDVRRLLGAVSECSGQAVAGDVDSLLIRAGEAEARMRALEQEKHLQADQIRALTDTIAALTRQMAERPASGRADLATALTDLARGDTAAAEAEFERVLEERSAAAASASHEAAEAARNIANLALFGNIDKAVRYYRRACELQPDHAETWRLLGHACLTAGDTAAAEEALTRARAIARQAGDTWGEMASEGGLGDVATVFGDLVIAAFHYTAAMQIAVERAACDPANTEWQRDLSVSHERIGDVLKAQGDGAGAITAYRKGLAIAEALAERDPANTEWQRDLSVSHNKIGDVLKVQGDGAGALAAYRKSQDIFEVLTECDPANTEWQRDLSVGHERIGGVLAAQGDGAGALAAYRTSLAIREALAARDPANTQWQRDLSVGHERIGDVLVARGDGARALAAYRKGLAITEALAARDPANTQWQRDLSVGQIKIGNVLAAQGDGAGALAAYRKELAIAEALAARDPANTQWLRDLSVSHERIGDVLAAQGDGAAALAAYRKGLDIHEALAERDPANTEWQRDLSVGHNKIGDVLAVQGDGAGALTVYRKGLAIAEALAERDPANAEWQRDLIVSNVKLSEVTGDKSFTRRALEIAESMQQRNSLAPRDARMIEELRRRAGE